MEATLADDDEMPVYDHRWLLRRVDKQVILRAASCCSWYKLIVEYTGTARFQNADSSAGQLLESGRSYQYPAYGGDGSARALLNSSPAAAMTVL